MMATYPGMSLGGEIRESISLDEDDLSDVEDEVFIRDGKNGYKFAEDIGVKRPLMAPRRKINKPDLRSRLKNRPPCRALCKPCCYIFGALLVLLGIIVLVVIIVSMFPLPINKIKNWIVTKVQENDTVKILPCSDLKITDVWTKTLPKLTTESSIRTIDINDDGVEDIIFGFGTGDNSALHQDIFCPMFMGVASPCGGGVLALNGVNGEIIWKKHLAHTIFTLFCHVDINVDGVFDCLAAGKGGVFTAINSKDGTTIWDFEEKAKDENYLMNIYTANFIPDQDQDGISDILAAHTSQKDRSRTGHLIIISGKEGKEIKRIPTPNNLESYYIPQLLTSNNEQYVLFGTGSPSSPGNLSAITLKNMLAGNETFITIYHDPFKGVLSPSILVDLTGDNQLDIVTAMFNSTVVAFDGSNFQQLWNVSVNNSETLSVPTPGYFTDDNVTDFLVKYQTGPEFPVYYYSQTFIIDGKSGKVIYETPMIDSVGSQMGGITLGMENFGYDFFLYWLSDCQGFEGRQDIYEFLPGSTLKEQSNADLCKLRFNSTKVAKLYALNQFNQPPGFEIYNSGNRTNIEYNNSKTPVEEATAYLKKHPEVQVQTSEGDESFKLTPESVKPVGIKDRSPFRHKDNNQGLVKDYSKPDRSKVITNPASPLKIEPDYDQPQDWQPKMYPPNYPAEIDYSNYVDESEPINIYNRQFMDDNVHSGRDVRGNTETTKTTKKNLSDKLGVYDYKNVKKSRSRLLHDLNNVPTEILKDTYLKNREQQLRKSRFEQRDLKSHIDKMKENEEVRRVLEEERQKIANASENLWTLESEKEAEEKKNGYGRGKRNTNSTFISGIPRISSVGSIVKAFNSSNNSIDIVFLTYWTPAKDGPQLLIERDYKCITQKIKSALNSKEEILNYEKQTLEEVFKKECLAERGAHHSHTSKPDVPIPNFPYYNQIAQLGLGQMTIYRLRIECTCNIKKKGERCAKFLNPSETRGWTSYLGKIGNGIFN